MVALTMMALALSEDSIRLRARRNEVINALGMLPEHVREVPSCLWPLSPGTAFSPCSADCSAGSNARSSAYTWLASGHCLLMVSTGLEAMRGAKLVGFGWIHSCLQVLKLDSQMLELAEELKTEQSLLVFGRGYNYATALEAALKVRCRRCWHGFTQRD